MGSAKIQGQLWGAEADTWSQIQEPQHTPLFVAMLEAAGVGAGSRLLDVGCGGGCSSGLALERGARVTGIDASEGMIDFARKAVPGAEFLVGDMEHLPFEDDSFDVVFCGNSVQYAADLLSALGEIRRVCKPDGCVVAGLFGPPESVAFTTVFKAIVGVVPPPPAGAKPGGPFVLSAPGVLAGKFEEARFSVTNTGEADCPFRYADFEQFWAGACRAGGPVQHFMTIVGEEKLKAAVDAARKPFTGEDGSIAFGPNMFIYITATP